MKKHFILALSLSIMGAAFAQQKDLQNFNEEYVNWYNKDIHDDEVMGVSVDKVYNTLIKDRNPKKTVVVAVIDGGVDIYHEDLKGKIWINEGEIPDNNIDDDNNGYIDDIHGWNFIGNASGENVNYENLEYTRIVKSGNTSDKNYEKAKELYTAAYEEKSASKKGFENYKQVILSAKLAIYENTGVKVDSKADLERVNTDNLGIMKAVKFLSSNYDQGIDVAFLDELLQDNAEYMDYMLNTEFDARALVGDDPLNLDDRGYGNNDVKGPRSSHGTSVAGVIAANRNNGIGIDGIATHVKIMAIRSTPHGDERDKDVALAIIYAVDNGADIINMSFGKDFSPQKDFVDLAVKYAEEKGVLLVHSAGNSGVDIDENENFPSDRYIDQTEASNWVNIGASQMVLDKELPGEFSNYGEDHVDIFAPGVELISLDSNSTYKMTSGTSIASPVFSGVAALVLSYYPDLTPQELIALLMDSSYKVEKPKKFKTPNLSDSKKKKLRFTQLSKCGGVVNAYNAILQMDSK